MNKTKKELKMDCINLKRGLMTVFIMLSLHITGLSQTGTIEGIATDTKNNEPLPGVTVVIDGTTLGSSADMDGHFLISNIKPGKYRIKVSYISYNSINIEEVTIDAGQTTKLPISLSESTVSLKEITVTGEGISNRQNEDI